LELFHLLTTGGAGLRSGVNRLARKQSVDDGFRARLAQGGFRRTRQREQVYAVLAAQRDHPTAEELFLRARRRMPDISMATVYNCLETLVKSGLAKPLHLGRDAARFCPNLRDHFHFYCEGCESVFDVELPAGAVPLPKGFRATRLELTVRGRCPKCGNGARPRSAGKPGRQDER
jgi:Fur family peroxide stress response transcriptional regulator